MRPMKGKPAERCEHCREPITRARVDVYRRRGKRHILFRNVPALVCTTCGLRIFERDAVEHMEHGLKYPPKRSRKTELTIISG